MNIKVKIVTCVLLLLLVGGGIICYIQGSAPVWAKRKLETGMAPEDCLSVNVCNGKVYYIEFGDDCQVAEVDPLSGECRTIRLNWEGEPETVREKEKRLLQVTVGEDGSIYGVLKAYNDGWNISCYLCKFTKQGELVYTTDISSQMWDSTKMSWSTQYQLEVDTKGRVYLAQQYKLFLFDENGNYEKYLDVNPSGDLNEPEIFDMAPGRDGSIYLIYDEDGKSYLMQVDYENGTLAFDQYLKYGGLFCFDAEEGIYLGAAETLYYYETDLPVAGRTAEALFDWWDLLIYKTNVQLIAAPKEDFVLVVVFNTVEDRCGVFLIEQMTKRQAKKEGLTYVEIP